MRDFQNNHADDALDGLLACEEVPMSTELCKACSAPMRFSRPLYRCFDCYMPPILCRPCLLEAHKHSPFHFVQEWDSRRRFWRRIPLSELGPVLHLGHEGRACSSASTPPRPMCLVSTHGIHTTSVGFCDCLDDTTGRPAPEATQLLWAGFWPSTWERPHTAFTVSLLKDFAMFSNQANVNAHGFYEILRRKTDKIAPYEIEVRPLSSHC